MVVLPNIDVVLIIFSSEYRRYTCGKIIYMPWSWPNSLISGRTRSNDEWKHPLQLKPALEKPAGENPSKRRDLMSLKRIVILLTLSMLVFGCAGSAKKFNALNVGMTKAEVIEAMGEPNYTSATKNVEILSYKLTSNGLFSETYFVRIVNGNVDRFGPQGSFGSFY
jgi:hypothetical protein